MQILLTGGTGFIGTSLVKRLLKQGHALTVVSRNPEKASALFGSAVKVWPSVSQWCEMTHFDAVINLAGEPIIDKAWTAKRKQALLDSRVGITEQLVSAMKKAQKKPYILLSGSAIGVYGDCGQAICTESAAAGTDFAAQLCRQWEQAARKAEAFGVRVALLRTGLVLAGHGGMLKKMRLPFSLGLGSQLGNGQQMMSWIHLDDYIEAVLFEAPRVVQHPRMGIETGAGRTQHPAVRRPKRRARQTAQRGIPLPPPAADRRPEKH